MNDVARPSGACNTVALANASQNTPGHCPPPPSPSPVLLPPSAGIAQQPPRLDVHELEFLLMLWDRCGIEEHVTFAPSDGPSSAHGNVTPPAGSSPNGFRVEALRKAQLRSVALELREISLVIINILEVFAPSLPVAHFESLASYLVEMPDRVDAMAESG